MIRTRVLFGTLLTAIALAVLLLDAYAARNWVWLEESALWERLLSRGGPYALLVMATGFMATREFNALLELCGRRPLRWWSHLTVFSLITIPWLAVVVIPDPKAAARSDMAFTMLALVIGTVGAAVALVFRREPRNGLSDFGGAVTGMVYLGLLFGFAVRLRATLPGPQGAWVALTWVLVVKFTDVGAYFSGLFAGRRPLIPDISPNKTVEGAVGGLVLGLIVATGAWSALPAIRPAFRLGAVESFWGLLICASILSILGQVGDLVESVFKRSAAAKDAGAMIPTFGGVLDVVDSLILTAPVAWALLAPRLWG